MTDSQQKDLSTVTPHELREILDKVGVHFAENTIRNLIGKGKIHGSVTTDPLTSRKTYSIPAHEVDRILGLYGKKWPRDKDGKGLLDPVGYLERKTAGAGPRMVRPGESIERD